MHSCARSPSHFLSLLYTHVHHTHTHTHNYSYSHTHAAWICFLCDERDYGIKEARPRQFSSVWTKAALSSSTMTNTDACLATHWRSAPRLTPRPPYFLSAGAPDWDSEAAVDLFFFRMTEDQQKHKRLTEICGWQQNIEELNSTAQECWNGSTASEDDLNISCVCFLCSECQWKYGSHVYFLRQLVSLVNSFLFSSTWQLLSRMPERVWHVHQQLHYTPAGLVIRF